MPFTFLLLPFTLCYNSPVMGHIIIDLPSRIKRHYRLDDKDLTSVILASLEAAALPIKENSAKLTAEDKADIRAAKRARKGELIAWEEAKAFLDRLG